MKRAELKKLVEGAGYVVRNKYEYLYILNQDEDRLIAINNKEVGSFDTDWVCFGELSLDKKEFLVDLATEYAFTPLEERVEPKKYYVRPKWIRLAKDEVLNYHRLRKGWSLDSKSNLTNIKTQFTLDELKELGVPIEHFDLEEVKG
jgi:hypothetical protein